MKTLKTWVAAATMVALSGAAQAALIDRGGGMIYDTTRNITWLADMNVNGLMTWTAANAWADSLVYGGFDDWRLPTLNPADTSCSDNFNLGGVFPTQYFGTGCTGGELSGLFVTDLGNKAGESVLNQVGDTAEQIANLALFSNVQSDIYWSGTEYAPNPANAWDFRTGDGYQALDGKRNALYAVAVRPGDVAASVPEPQTLALALLALGATVVARSRRPTRSGRSAAANAAGRQARSLMSPTLMSMHRPASHRAARTLRNLIAAALVAAGAVAGGGAHADVVKSFSLSFDGYTATGILTLADTPTVDNHRLVIGLEGVMNGDGMTLLPAGVFPGIAPSDNLVDTDSDDLLTYYGLSWSAGGRWWNLYRDPGVFSVCSGEVNDPDGCHRFFDDARFTLGDPVVAVPTPATLPLIALGALALVTTSRKRLGR